MSRTYRRGTDGQTTADGGRYQAKPRYRPGSRRKQHQITANPIRRQPPDLEQFGQAIVRAALTESPEPDDGTKTQPYHPVGNRTRPTPTRPKSHPTPERRTRP
jgi:hypothetical protein